MKAKTKPRRRPKQQARGVKLRKIHYKSRGKAMTAHEISVPNEIALHIPPDARFKVELTEGGILFRRIIRTVTKLPAWVSQGKDGAK